MEQDGSSTDRIVRRHRKRSSLAIGLGMLIAACIGGVYLFPSLSRWASADRSVAGDRIRLAEVTRGDLLRDVSVQGKVVAAERPTLVSPAQGVVSLLVKAGDVVTDRDVVARIDSPQILNQLEQEQSILLSMESDLERQRNSNHQNELQNQQEVSLLELRLKAGTRAMERARRLFEQGLGSSADFEKAQDEVELTRLELEHAREKARLATENMSFETRAREMQLERQRLVVADVRRKVLELSVLSPVNGLVSRVDVRDKDTVQPNQALLTVVDLSRFEVEVLIPENYADEISIGTPATILCEGRDYDGFVKSVSPEVESSQVKGIVDFGSSAPAGLKQNQRVETRLILDSRLNVVKVPRGPFLESMGGRQVYVVEEGVASLRPISVGSISVTEVEITSGLEPGETIVVSDMTRFEGAQTILLR